MTSTPIIFFIFGSVHLHICNELESIRREAPTAPLECWNHIEKRNVTSLRKRRLYMALLLINPPRAFLYIQASSASCERRFGDEGHGEGDRRQHVLDSMSEMHLMIRRFTLSYIDNAESQVFFLRSRAQSIKDLEGLICDELKNHD